VALSQKVDFKKSSKNLSPFFLAGGKSQACACASPSSEREDFTTKAALYLLLRYSVTRCCAFQRRWRGSSFLG
jgi:hypothetical protein